MGVVRQLLFGSLFDAYDVPLFVYRSKAENTTLHAVRNFFSFSLFLNMLTGSIFDFSGVLDSCCARDASIKAANK